MIDRLMPLIEQAQADQRERIAVMIETTRWNPPGDAYADLQLSECKKTYARLVRESDTRFGAVPETPNWRGRGG